MLITVRNRTHLTESITHEPFPPFVAPCAVRDGVLLEILSNAPHIEMPVPRVDLTRYTVAKVDWIVTMNHEVWNIELRD